MGALLTLACGAGTDWAACTQEFWSSFTIPAPCSTHTGPWFWADGVAVSWGYRFDPEAGTCTPTATAGQPSPRTGHTILLAGNRLIVWGGTATAGGSLLNDGAKYDILQDAWSPITLLAAPTARSAQTAVWTGSEMLIWGGLSPASSVLGDGGAYNPETDSWREIPGSALMAPRSGHEAVWSGSEMIVWGGAADRSGGRFDPVTGLWQATSLAGAPDTIYSNDVLSLWAGDRMLVSGGWYDLYSPFPGAPDYHRQYRMVSHAYDPVTDSWSSIAEGLAQGEKGSVLWTGTEALFWNGLNCYWVHFGGPDYLTCENLPGIGRRLNPQTGEANEIRSPAWEPGGGYFGISPIWTGSSALAWWVSGAEYHLQYPPPGDLTEDTDGDGWCPAIDDCDNTRATVYPSAPQLCGDGLNNDCTHPSWPTLTGTNEADDDLDLMTECAGDCDDALSAVYRGAPEICGDRIANDCLFPTWPHNPADYDLDLDGFIPCGGPLGADCDDARAEVYPGAPQLCDGLNNDCSDPSWPAVAPEESDGDSDGWLRCLDCNDLNGAVFPGAPQWCGDGLNNDCLHPDWPADTTQTDDDADGQAECGAAGDCDDSRASVYSFAPQLCGDVLNNDCRHASWPALAGTNESDDDGDGLAECSVAPDCDDALAGAWGTPGEVAGVTADYQAGPGTMLQWTGPVPPGGTATSYDVLRSTVPWDFVVDTMCLESNGTDLAADDPDGTVPPPFGTYFYLIRAENGCPGGAGRGILGRNTAGAEILGRNCP